MPRVVTVGRLDFMSEGLLLLTNDGGLARRLELPANGWIRRYRARVHGTVDEARLAALANGITIEGVRYGAIQAKLDRQQRSNAWLEIALAEGKNREVRRVLAHLDLPVVRLIRVAFGPFHLGELDARPCRRDPGAGARQPAGRQAAAAQAGLGQTSLQGAATQETAALMLKIVGGKHRGRALMAPEGGATRPTASRAREALFNILVHAKWREDGTSPLIDARVLDAFAGTGALGLRRCRAARRMSPFSTMTPRRSA